MTQVFQVGDIVRVRTHYTGEKQDYPLNWNKRMDDWEELCGIVTIAHMKAPHEAENWHVLLPCPFGFTIKPGDDFRAMTDKSRRQPFSFVESSLTLVHRSPWRSIQVNGGPLPLVGEWDEHTTKRFAQEIRWTGHGVTVNGVIVLPSRIPHTNVFTTF